MMTHLESSLWDDSDSYRLMNGTTTITEQQQIMQQNKQTKKKKNQYLRSCIIY